MGPNAKVGCPLSSSDSAGCGRVDDRLALFTDYELGVVKRPPMPTYLTLDLLSGLLLTASPWLFGFSELMWMPHLVLGVLEVGAALMTKTTAFFFALNTTGRLVLLELFNALPFVTCGLTGRPVRKVFDTGAGYSVIDEARRTALALDAPHAFYFAPATSRKLANKPTSR